MFDGEAFGKEVVGAVKAHLDKALGPVLARLEALEKRQPEKGADGAAGRDGKDAEPITVEQIADAVRSMPEAISGAVDEWLKVNPPAAGKDGSDGKDGEPGADGRDGKDGKDGEKGIDGKDGADGDPGAPGRDGVDGKDGNPGRDGKDGCGVKDLLIDRSGELVATFDDGRTKNLGLILGKDGSPGQPGKDGRDGFSLTDFDATLQEDGRTVVLSFTQGEIKHCVELGIPAMIYRGVYSEGRKYARGDTVTWGGSLWHCDAEETETKPDGAEKHWTLAAKRGRDGKDGIIKADKGPAKVKVA